MIAEVRIYTANKGKLDEFVKVWTEKLQPIHEQYGLKILGAWVNRPENEFVWIRAFESEADRDAKVEAYFASPERKAIGDLPQSLLAKTEVRTVEQVYMPSPVVLALFEHVKVGAR
jgi:heme-degrading monooxygenase HmoA